jgi:protein-disulfide isomerase
VGPLLDEAYVATGQVLHVFRNFPLDFHPNATPAAQAAYCIGQQGPELFWQMHDWLFANQDTWSGAEDAAKQFRDQALAMGVDAAEYDACVSAPATLAFIQRDIAAGEQLGVQGTPAFFINDWFLGGAYPYEDFKATIDQALQGLHPPPTATPLPPGVAPYDPDPARPGLTYDGSPTRGNADANLVLIGFNDFQCPTCITFFNDVVPGIKSKYLDTGQMREVFKFFPSTAPNAAVASLCALDQGKFWEYADLLYSNADQWTDGDNAAMIGYAKSLGLDEAKFSQCLNDAPGKAQVDADTELVGQLGLPEPPFFILIDLKAQNGIPIPGTATAEQFDQAVQSLLNPPTPAPTVAPPTPAPTATP